MKLKDPLFYLGLVTGAFWIADFILKIFVLGTPSRIFWLSSTGLGLTTIGLFTRNRFLLTAMFCALLIPEGMYIPSFLGNIFFQSDPTKVAAYAFAPSFPTFRFVVTMHHLTIIPSLITGILLTRKIHPHGWIGATFYVLIIGMLSFIFSDSTENINCIQRERVGSCSLYFSYFYQFEPASLRIFFVTGLLGFFVYLPINLLLLFAARRLGWQK